MLSNPTNLQQRQRQHRRQQSTPTAFEATKLTNLPITQRHGLHRRGMSLDQRQQRQSPPQDINTVTITNQGFNDNQQQLLREAQQQRLARPGHHIPDYTQTNDENCLLISPLVTNPQSIFDTAVCMKYGVSQESPSPYASYSDNFNSTIQINPNGYGHSLMSSGSGAYSGSGTTTPDMFDFSIALEESSSQEDWGLTIRPKGRNSARRRVSGGIAERVAQFEGLGTEQLLSRPMTPPNHNSSIYFPPTPDPTPFNHGFNVNGAPQRFSESYDMSMEETIKPGRNRSNQRTQTIFQEMRNHAELTHPPSPPSSGQLPSPARFDSARMPPSKSVGNFMNMENLKMNFDDQDEFVMGLKHSGYESSNCSPTHLNITPETSRHSSPEASHASIFRGSFDIRPHLESAGGQYYLPQSPGMDMNSQMSPSRRSHQRSESVDSINVDEAITDTGITIDDIAQWIDGPDAVDQKWSCLYPECGKRFGRKENIKSHVQTHLGDRQYQCPHCKKCFVRQHDLKRHAKIHSGVKPYPCACGNSFARHDALTRHRQRGMCVGAFEGVVKKIVKRGRPRKPRPDDEERLEKSSKTRSKNNRKAMSSSSSISSYSDSSSGKSHLADNPVLDDKPFGEFLHEFEQPGRSQRVAETFYSSAASPVPIDCVSPQAIQKASSPAAESPSAFSIHSHYARSSQAGSHHSHRNSVVSIADLHTLGVSIPPSPSKSSVSQYNTPPGLCLSSSPPSGSQFFDPATAEDDEIDLSRLSQLQMNPDEEDIFLETFESTDSVNMGAMSHLEQDVLMRGKFEMDDPFANVVNDDDVFRHCDDIFFGSP